MAYDVKTAKSGDTFKGINTGCVGWTLHITDNHGGDTWHGFWTRDSSGEIQKLSTPVSLSEFFKKQHIKEPNTPTIKEPEQDIWSL